MMNQSEALVRVPDVDVSIDAAMKLVDQGDLQGAVNLLDGGKLHDDAQICGLLGTWLLLLGEYRRALPHLERAVQLDGGNPDWRAMLLKAGATLATRANESYPPYAQPDAARWLGPPAPVEGVLPVVRPAAPRRKLLRSLRKLVGEVIGEATARALEPLTWAAGYLGTTAGEVWTNWYRKPLFLGIMTLAYMREQLNRRNLTSTYPDGELVAFQSRGMVAPESPKLFRTADGSWNNLSDPKEGAAHVRFPRNVNRMATWPRKAQLLSPNPAEISQSLLARGPEGMKQVPFLNMLAAAWIQFNVHDWVSHRTGVEPDYFEIPLPENHPARARYHQSKMFVHRTERDPTRKDLDEGAPPTYINEVTSWWDASQIYGSDQVTADRLRSFQGGKLKLDADKRLPAGDWGFEDSGFVRNWWVGLAMLHTLFVREHNAVCEMLAGQNRGWDDNRLYHTARLVTAAVIAKIHTVEWTPAILPNPGLNMAMNANWFGLLEASRHKLPDRRVFPWIKISNAELGGIVGNAIDKHGKPFGLSEEFTEIYRLHELLPDELVLRRIGGQSEEKIALAEVRQAGARNLSARVPMADLFYSFGNMNPGQLVLNNYPHTLRELSLPGNPVFDLAAVDILRARERGVPRYNEFRRQLGLKPIRKFEDLTSDPTTARELARIYENDIEAIDLLVGTRAETTRPTGYGFGETMFQLFILNASRRLQADRFYTDCYNEETYTQVGLDWIDAADFKSVLLRHYPELARTGLANVRNAFEPWDVGELSAERHPLARFA